MSWTQMSGGLALALPGMNKRPAWAARIPARSPQKMVAPTGREEIKDDIEAKCRTGYSYWRIGLTHNLLLAKEYWSPVNNRLADWTDWTATSLSEARKIEEHFISKGMQCTACRDLSLTRPVHVYVFWSGPTPAGENYPPVANPG